MCDRAVSGTGRPEGPSGWHDVLSFLLTEKLAEIRRDGLLLFLFSPSGCLFVLPSVFAVETSGKSNFIRFE